jgi:HPt (histidine-containing phosphotransfer) domain-containing protein
VTSTNSETDLQKKLQAIATRYIDRTVLEAAVLRSHIDACIAGEIARLADIESIAHRIHGSGAMLGFQDLSEQAAALERFVAPLRASKVLDASLTQDLSNKLTALEQSLQRAAAQHAAPTT